VDPKQRITEKARELGFEAVAFARADLPLEDDYARYEAFLAGGMHGSMDWLASNREARRRVDTDHVLAGAKTVICLAQPYARGVDDEANDPPVASAIARYARGRDYHNWLRRRLRRLATFVRALGTAEAPVEARPLCDQEPVLERAWAARAGLGFVGKNGLLIVPGVGSLVLLGEVVTTLEVEPDSPIPERCGACTRCLDACPTGAFARPFVLDARLCIAYLTIENRGPIPTELRPAVGARLFGCDECQTVCPFNARARTPLLPHRPVDPRFLPEPRWGELDMAALLSLDEAGFAALREGSPVGRARLEGLARNAAVVMGNARDERHRSALVRAKEGHPSEIVREAATWALAQLDEVTDSRPRRSCSSSPAPCTCSSCRT